MASEVAFLRGETGQWLTTSSRYSRNRISDRAGALVGKVSMTLYISDRIQDIRGEFIFSRSGPIRNPR